MSDACSPPCLITCALPLGKNPRWKLLCQHSSKWQHSALKDSSGGCVNRRIQENKRLLRRAPLQAQCFSRTSRAARDKSPGEEADEQDDQQHFPLRDFSRLGNRRRLSSGNCYAWREHSLERFVIQVSIVHGHFS